ncbi:MAG: translesion DNA synthesis-associated protein ImuA [Gammaproteobacteria bacterium]
MTMSALETLLANPRIWRGPSAAAAPGIPLRSTGWQALDAALPQQGWPDAGLVEVLSAVDGLGELSLILPVLAALSAEARPILVVAPPYRPYAPTWRRAGIRLTQLHVLETAAQDAPWAMEQALRAGCCGAVLGWPGSVDDRTLRRLQVAADGGRTLGFVFRPLAAAGAPSPAPLRLCVEATTTGTAVRILKCRGSHPPAHGIPFGHTAH